MRRKLDGVAALMVLIEELKYEGSDTGPAGSQAEYDADRISEIITEHGMTSDGPFVCSIGGCGREYSTPHLAADCWKMYGHTAQDLAARP